MPVWLLKVGVGMFLGYPSVLLPALQAPGADLRLDLHQASWFASLSMLLGIVGVLTGSWAMSRFGRRRTLMASCVPAVVGLAVMWRARGVPALVVGRTLHAASMGANVLVGIVLLSEASSPSHRAALLNVATAALNVGSLLVHSLALYVSWRTLALFIAVPFLLSLVLAYFCPESPSWLAEMKQFERSREAFYWLRGRTEDSTREIESLIESQHDRKIIRTFSENVTELFGKFKKRNFLKPVGVVLIGVWLAECSGRHVFPTYAATLVERVAPSGGAAPAAAAADALVAFSGLTAAALLRCLNLRTLLFTTGPVAVLALSSVSLSQYLLQKRFISEDYEMVSLILFLAFFVFVNLGCTCIPVVLKGELFPLEHRAVASMFLNMTTKVTTTILIKVTPYMIIAFEIYGYFAISAGAIAACLLGMYFTLPETRDRTLQELDEYFRDGEFRVRARDARDACDARDHRDGVAGLCQRLFTRDH